MPNQATAIDAAIQDLYVGEGEDGMAHVDISSVIDALVEGTAGDVRFQIQRSDGERDLFPETLSERNMWNDLALEVTDTARDFVLTLWEDRNGDSFVDAGEQKLEVAVHVIPSVVSGTIEYSAGPDRSPLRYAELDLADDRGRHLYTTTDGDGKFTFHLNAPPDNWPAWTLTARTQMASSGQHVRKVRVVNNAHSVYDALIPLPTLQDGVAGGEIRVDATGDHAIAAGSLMIQLESLAGRAFCLFDAAITGWLFSNSLPNVSVPTVSLVYDANMTRTTFTVPSEGGSTITYQTDELPYYWDSVLHEYGHSVAYVNGFDRDDLLSAKHYPGINCRSLQWWSSSAKQLAFNEGFANFYSVAAQANAPVATLPEEHFTYGINDGRFRQDSVENNLARRRGDGAGEDEELSVMRILWDMCDPANEPFDRVQMPVGDLIDTLSSHQIRTLSSLCSHLTTGAAQQRVFDYGAILETVNAAPKPLGLYDHHGIAKTIWTGADQVPDIIWQIPQGNERNTSRIETSKPVGNLFDQFCINFWDANNNLIESIAVSQADLTCLSDHRVAYSMSPTIWLGKIASMPGLKSWSVSGRWNCMADSYWYSSDARAFTIR